MNPQDGQELQVNPDHVINSLLNQNTTLSLNVAQLNAVIIQQTEQLEEYRKKEVAEMDGAVAE